jgi:pimeloyl-ACP methyl ester carboxylesterase
LTTALAHTDEVFPYKTADGIECNVTHVTGPTPPTKGPVLLVHGVGVRKEIWRPPTPRTIVEALIDDGFDVWISEWRASKDVPNNTWTLDQAAVLDHPPAVKLVLEKTGADSIQALTHCQGSTSFAMAACAGLLPEVRTIVSSAVTLHPVVPKMSAFKLRYVVPIVSRLTGYLDPQWGIGDPPWILPKVVTAYCKLSRRKCDNGVCKVSSFMFGAGDPTLWTHEQLSAATHEWTKGEFGAAPLTFFQQISKCVQEGHLVSVEGRPELPENFVAQPPQTDARFSFITGSYNHTFTPESQQNTFDWFEKREPGRHSLHIVPKYGHLDVFVGENAQRDWHPIILGELNKPQ